MFEKEFVFYGKHASYVKNLVKEERAGLFKRNLDVLRLAPIIGFLNGRKSKRDNGEETTKVFTSQLVKEKRTLEFIYKLIMILDNRSEEKSEEDVLKEALDDTYFDQNKKVFNSYVLGGVEILHDKLYEESLDKDDYLNNLYNFVQSFEEDLLSRTSKEDINEIIRKYD